MSKRVAGLLIVVAALVAFGVGYALQSRTAERARVPKLPPMQLFKIVHDRSCWAIITDANCYTAYLYEGQGSLGEVVQATYANLSSNPDYNVEATDADTLHVSYKHVEPNEVKQKESFDIDFMAAPETKAAYRDFFAPTATCTFGSNCVEAQIFID